MTRPNRNHNSKERDLWKQLIKSKDLSIYTDSKHVKFITLTVTIKRYDPEGIYLISEKEAKFSRIVNQSLWKSNGLIQHMNKLCCSGFELFQQKWGFFFPFFFTELSSRMYVNLLVVVFFFCFFFVFFFSDLLFDSIEPINVETWGS